MIVSSCQHCDEQQFQTLSCVVLCTLHDFLSSRKLALFISTAIRSHSCSGKTTCPTRVHLVLQMY